MCILCVYTRNTPCYTQFYNQVPFTLHVISLMDQWILLKWFLSNFCFICCSNWKSSAGGQFISYSNRRAVCWDFAKNASHQRIIFCVMMAADAAEYKDTPLNHETATWWSRTCSLLHCRSCAASKNHPSFSLCLSCPHHIKPSCRLRIFDVVDLLWITIKIGDYRPSRSSTFKRKSNL
jgi:hypothetical protein